MLGKSVSNIPPASDLASRRLPIVPALASLQDGLEVVSQINQFLPQVGHWSWSAFFFLTTAVESNQSQRMNMPTVIDSVDQSIGIECL